MNDPLAVIIVHGSAPGWYFFPVALVVAVVSLSARYGRIVAQWLSGIRGKDWMTTQAVVDVVSVVPQTVQTRYGERVVGCLATLTYFYHNPELQVGEFSRIMSDEDEANSWAESYKGKTLTIRVDPRDPSNSVLRKADL